MALSFSQNQVRAKISEKNPHENRSSAKRNCDFTHVTCVFLQYLIFAKFDKFSLQMTKKSEHFIKVS